MVYHILRNATVDHYRRRSARAKAQDALAKELPESYEETWATTVCGCIGGVLDDLKPEYREAVQQIDLDEVPLSAFASE